MKICIIGVGNIGFRYAQGIARTFPKAELILVDRPDRLAALRESELHHATLRASLDELEHGMDLIVVATSCKPRLAIYKQCLALKPRFVILEKYLFSDRHEMHEALGLDRAPTFVNQWMYGSKTFDCLFSSEATTVEVSGSQWGLGCNAVHWMDVLQRHLNITDLQVGPDTVIDEVFPSKRPGYEEIAGKWAFIDGASDRSFALIDVKDGESGGGMSIDVDGKRYLFDYASVRDGEQVLSRFPYFSDQIGGIVRDILDNGRGNLPSLETSVAQHLLVEDILDQLDHRALIT